MTSRTIYLATALFALGGCTSAFVSTWKAPDAQPFELRGAKVAAVAMMSSESGRRAAELALANEITTYGAQGVPMYQIFPDAEPKSEPEARKALERAGMTGVVSGVALRETVLMMHCSQSAHSRASSKPRPLINGTAVATNPCTASRYVLVSPYMSCVQ